MTHGQASPQDGGKSDELTGQTRHSRAGGVSWSVLLLTALGLLSLVLLGWAHRSWSLSLRQFVPMMDHMMETKDSLAEAHLLLEKHLRGSDEGEPEELRRAYDRALASVDACLEGRSAVPGLEGMPVRSIELSGQLREFRALIEKTGEIAEARCSSGRRGAATPAEDLQMLAVYHGLSLKSRTLNAYLQEDIESQMSRQWYLHLVGAGVWVVILGLSARALARHAKSRREAEVALQDTLDGLEVTVAERTAELQSTNQRLATEVEERSRAQQALAASQGKLKHLSAQLINAQEEERQRIARELHDSTTQTLGAAKFAVEHALQLPAGDLEGRSELRERVVPMIQNALEEVRRIYMDLRPSMLDDLGAVSAVEWLCRQFGEIYDHIEVTRAISVAEEQIQEPLKIVVFRVLQEAMNNVAKHSDATRLTVSLLRTGAVLELRVEDDGKGIPDQTLSGREHPAGVGIGSMKERVEGSGGDFLLDSAPGSGTRIRARWSV